MSSDSKRQVLISGARIAGPPAYRRLSAAAIQFFKGNSQAVGRDLRTTDPTGPEGWPKSELFLHGGKIKPAASR
jgi:hypothetical protein